MNVSQSIVVASQLFAEREALVFEGRSYTFRQVEALSARAAGVLRERGVEPQDRVGLIIPNVPAFVVWYYGCLRLGAIAVSVSTRLTGDEVAFILSDCDARVLIGTPQCLEPIKGELAECLGHVLHASDDGQFCDDQPLEGRGESDPSGCAALDPDDPATILYTSGTTGFPKGATLSHRNVCATVHAFNHLCQMRTEDRLLLAVPLFHCYGQNALLNAGFNVGATIVLQRGFDLNESRRLIADQQVTKLFGVPATFQLMLEACEPEDLASIEYCFSAAATLPLSISQRWLAKFGMPIYEGYGLTETAPFASYNHRLKYVPGSLGTPVDLVEMKVVNPDSGQECPPGCPGEIAIRGPNVMLGYWNRPEETAAAIRDGWFYSGDIGETDEYGYFYILDRLKDMIVVGGLKVYPAEVERVLQDHPSVAEAAVVGFPDEVLGEKVVAFVVGRDDEAAKTEQLRDYCRQHLAGFKVPAFITWVDNLPRNPAGKVLKRELRRFELSPTETDSPRVESTAAAQPENCEPRDSGTSLAEINRSPQLVELVRGTHTANRVQVLTSHVQSEFQDLAGLKMTPAAELTFIEAGMDSLMMVEFRDRLQRQIGSRGELSATFVFDHPTPADLATHLVDLLADNQAGSRSRHEVPTQRPLHGERTFRPESSYEREKRIEEMSEETARAALMRELEQ